MGYMRHHAILVTGPIQPFGKTPALVIVRDAVAAKCPSLVSHIVEARLNGYGSFAVFPDGSKEGWEDSAVGDQQRENVVAYLRSLVYEDGSTSFDWALVQYGDDEGETVIIDHSDKQRRES